MFCIPSSVVRSCIAASNQVMNKWLKLLPHPVVMISGMLLLAALLSYVMPAGKFERVEMDGRQTVVAGSFKYIDSDPLSLMDLFMCLPLGFKTAVDIIFIVMASGIMFGFMEKSGSIENAIGTLIKTLGLKRKYLIVVVMTFVFGSLGVFVGYENNIAMIPVACLLSLAIGGDLMLAAGISVGAITVGFGLSPVNPYTIGTGHRIAELPLFSGYGLRSILCFCGLAVMAFYNVRYFMKITKDPGKGMSAGIDTHGFTLSKPLDNYSMSSRDYLIILIFFTGIGVILNGVFSHHWFINQISAIFCIMAVAVALVCRTTSADFGKTVLHSVSEVAPGASMVGFANSVKVALETAQISDTIAYYLSESLMNLPVSLTAIGMVGAQSLMNFVIPSGSGQALATLPVMIPVGELTGMTRQTTILAFQIGDGVSNLVNPSLGGIVAMLSMCRIPFDRWMRFIFPLFILVLLISTVFVVISVKIRYGPF